MHGTNTDFICETCISRYKLLSLCSPLSLVKCLALMNTGVGNEEALVSSLLLQSLKSPLAWFFLTAGPLVEGLFIFR